VREQRITCLAIAILTGLSVFMTPILGKLIHLLYYENALALATPGKSSNLSTRIYILG
jgi:hypothetical protein